MATAVLEKTASKLALHARCIEAAVHQPGNWAVIVEGERYPVFVEATQDDSILTVVFLAGPMPEGEHVVLLEVDGLPMYGSTVTFGANSWWKHTLSHPLD